MTTVEYLKQVYRYDVIINIFEEFIKSAEHDIKAYDMVAPYSDRVRAVIASAEKRKKINISCRKEIIKGIEAIQEPACRTVLYARYVEHKDWKTISNDMMYDCRTVFRIHKKAINLFENLKATSDTLVTVKR